jgi:hypothetical protein
MMWRNGEQDEVDRRARGGETNQILADRAGILVTLDDPESFAFASASRNAAGIARLRDRLGDRFVRGPVTPRSASTRIIRASTIERR